MSRDEIEVGAFSWARIQRLYDADRQVHWERCEAQGLQCPQEVFMQLFHAEDVNAETQSADEMLSGPNLLSLDSLRGVDWGRVRWDLQEMSGIAMRHMRVDREFQHALDAARNYATGYGIVDDREEVVSHWKEAKSWIVPPVAASGDLLGFGGGGFELLVGYTRLGNLLGMLDRQEIPEVKKHLVWVGKDGSRN